MSELENLKARLMGDAPPGAVVIENGRERGDKGRQYRVGERAAAAVFVADLLNKPLLIAGEPGCGKTELGYAAALRLGIPRLNFFSVKSGSEAMDLFYTYDSLRRFRRAQLKNDAAQDGDNAADYVTYQALGCAILLAHPPKKVEPMLRGRDQPDFLKDEARRQERSIVVIDEIDKAPRDFCNDLLREIEDLSFRVPELEQDGVSPPGGELADEFRPLIFITSNQETQLPDAFLRRCVFLWIDFPTDDELHQILAAHLGASVDATGLDDTGRKGLVKLVSRFRELKPQKQPGVAEMLDAGRLMRDAPAGASASDWLSAKGRWSEMLAHTLVKLNDDRPLFDAARQDVEKALYGA